MVRQLTLILLLMANHASVQGQSADTQTVGGAVAVPPTLVIMGSSTAAGSGASTPDSSWAGRYTRYLKQFYPEVRVINLAAGGYGTHHLLPDGWTIPDGRPLPDPERNISRALTHHPDVIILNLPSNDASQSYPAEEQLANFETIVGQAQAAGALVWVTTTQPRNFEPYQIEIQRQVRTGLMARYGDHCIDFWEVLSTSEGLVDQRYDSGDGIHLNDAGHRLLAQKVVDSNVLVQWLGISSIRKWWDGVLGRLVQVI